jgi:hypothetical protein
MSSAMFFFIHQAQLYRSLLRRVLRETQVNNVTELLIVAASQFGDFA